MIMELTLNLIGSIISGL